MPINFVGDTFTSTDRVITQCHSLDWALADTLGNVGYPTKSVTEIYGAKGTGKTTLATSLMGMIAAKLQKDITLLDWEGQSKDTIEGILDAQKFFGTVDYLLNKGDESPEDTLERFVEKIKKDNQNVALMDSLGAFTPSALINGKIGDANMGVMAREIGQFVSKVVHFSRMADEPGAIFLTNHLHPKIGSMMSGQDTSGGEKKKFLAHIRMDLKRCYIGNSAVDFGESYLLKGHIDHNRFGFPKRDFYVFILGGQGIHVGMTALWDCVMAGHADLSAKSIKDSVGVSMDGTSFGKFRSILQEKNNPEFFVPFINKLRENVVEEIVDLGNGYSEVVEVEEETPKKRGKK
jgi:RecA/RadA recombinase